MSDKTLIKFPTRARPALFFRTLSAWRADDTVRVLVSIDADDTACNNPDFIGRLLAMEDVKVRVGHSKSKVEAINDGVVEEEWSFIVLASDDMIPQRPDYAQHLRKILFDKWPDGDGVLHVNDGRNGPALNTGVIMGRTYFNRFGYLYSPRYMSLWVDNELHAVAEALGRQLYVPEVVIKHEWTNATGKDALHERNESFYEADGLTFGARKLADFPH